LTAVLNLTPALAETPADEAAIRSALGPGVELKSVKPAAIPGLYEVIVGAQVLYVSADGRYLIDGSIFDTKTEKSLTEATRKAAVTDAIDAIGEKNMIVFSPKEKKHTLTVFTDIDCGYCRKLHSEIDSYLDKGIEIHYMLFPRAGKNSESYRKAVAVWCSEDRNEALTVSKSGKAIPMQTCDNPVDEHMELATELGLRGTPLLVLEDGRLQPGYAPAEAIAQYYAAGHGSN
jgi:thiol:disulfide interchange protein DsbC